MTARLAKETRELLPLAGATWLLILVPYLVWHRDAEPFGVLIFAIGCAIMAANAFGHELQDRTLALLLVQPVPRPVLWREKMGVLAAGLAAAAAVLTLCKLVYSGDHFRDTGWGFFLCLAPFCAFCGAPGLTLWVRSAITGAVVAILLPLGVGSVTVLAVAYVVPESWGAPVFVTSLAVYCAVAYWLGYRKFRRLQVVESPGRELALPPRLQAFLSRAMGRLPAVPGGAFGALVRKELRLQQTALLVAGLFCLMALAGACFYHARPRLAEAIVGFDLFVYMAILPFIVGAVAAAEERFWGVSGWHLTLPASARQQWRAKLAVTLAVGLVLGLLLPGGLLWLGAWLVGPPRAANGFPHGTALALCVLVEWLAVSLAFYTATFCNSALKAVLVAFALILTFAFGVQQAVQAFDDHVAARLSLRVDGSALALWSCVALLILIALVQRFAFVNFRRPAVPVGRLAAQIPIFLVITILLALLAVTQSLR